MGLAWGFLGVAAFSVTLPATRAAVTHLDPVFVGLGRAVAAAVLAGGALAYARSPLPSRAQVKDLALVALGVVVGFPLLSAWAMRQVPASHGAVLTGLLPLATAGAAAWLAHERPGARFWLWAIFGSLVVAAYAVWRGGGAPHPADLLLIGAVAAAAGLRQGCRARADDGRLAGHLVGAGALGAGAERADLARRRRPARKRALDRVGGIRLRRRRLDVPRLLRLVPRARAGRDFGGRAGAAASAVLTILASALLLSEALDPLTFVAAGLVIVSIAMGRRG